RMKPSRRLTATSTTMKTMPWVRCSAGESSSEFHVRSAHAMSRPIHVTGWPITRNRTSGYPTAASNAAAMRARPANMALPNMEAPVLKPPLHGGDLGEIMRRFPDAPTPWLDLSTGINPVPYPVGALPDEAWTRLPARESERALLDAGARRYGVRDPASIVAA